MPIKSTKTGLLSMKGIEYVYIYDLTSDDFNFLGKFVPTATDSNTDAFDEYEAMDNHNGEEASKNNRIQVKPIMAVAPTFEEQNTHLLVSHSVSSRTHMAIFDEHWWN
jgi:hypothetical protein